MSKRAETPDVVDSELTYRLHRSLSTHPSPERSNRKSLISSAIRVSSRKAAGVNHLMPSGGSLEAYINQATSTETFIQGILSQPQVIVKPALGPPLISNINF